ncbi:DUF421 domain-containing protein [Chitinophagaceae bacterium MMS25-I14]
MNLVHSSNIWMGSNNWDFLPEVILRSLIMFVIVVISMRILGKRGVMQLSVFELVILLILGSAAGDPMLYKEVGILPACLVLLFVVALYRAVIFVLSRNRRFEVLIKGRPQFIIKEGEICIDSFRKQPLAFDELYGELRLQHVSHLGQIRYAVIETSGEISVFFYSISDVRYGLPILPGSFDGKICEVKKPGEYSCVYCGHSTYFTAPAGFTCSVCQHHYCIASSNEHRMS